MNVDMHWKDKVLLMRRVASAVVVLLLVGGCASGPPGPKKLLRMGADSHAAGDHAAAVAHFQTVVDVAPHELNKTRSQDELALYRDSQIHYGLEQARSAEAAGSLVKAWVYFAQTAMADDARQECIDAGVEADRLREMIASQHLGRVDSSLARADIHGAVAAAAQAAWFGASEEATHKLADLEESMGTSLDAWAQSAVVADGVAGLVRTDSYDLLAPGESYAPYGVPVFFGDAPFYYVKITDVEVEGVPQTQKIPSAYSAADSLSYITSLARFHEADAIVNVHLWTKSQKSFTRAELVRFADLEPQKVRKAITRIGDGGE